MPDPWEENELARRFREVAATHDHRAPLYAALAAGIARRPALAALLGHAPPRQQLPVLLFACVHALLLDEPEHELARWYPNLTPEPRPPTDPALMVVFSDFVDDRAPALFELLATRRTQTNEVGRCALLLPPMASYADECGPLAMIDVGASAGLNLLIDRYAYRYGFDDGSLHAVGADAPLTLNAGVRGAIDLPTTLPTIAARRGIDVAPIDVTKAEEARWLEACVWPDQPDRFRRLRSAIALAQESPPEIVQGDAVDSIRSVVDRVADGLHPVVTDSWALNYLDPSQQQAFTAEMEAIGAERDVSWIVAESPDLTPGLPWHLTAGQVSSRDAHLTHLASITWRDGAMQVRSVATCHPHGYWMRAVDAAG